MKHRYQELLEALNVTAYQLEKFAGLGNGIIGKAIGRNSAPSRGTTEILANAIPGLSKEWLIFGTGEMMEKGATLPDLSKSLPAKRRHEALPLGEPVGDYTNKTGTRFVELGSGKYVMLTKLVPQRSAAGYMSGWGDPEYIEELPEFPIIVDRPHKGDYRTFEIEANNYSMDDGTKRSIEPGDFVTGRKINRSLWQTDKLHLGNWPIYTIVHREHGIVTKEIVEHDVEAGTITCRSFNPDKKKYPDFDLNLAGVNEIYNIVRVSKTNITGLPF